MQTGHITAGMYVEITAHIVCPNDHGLYHRRALVIDGKRRSGHMVECPECRAVVHLRREELSPIRTQSRVPRERVSTF